MRKVSTSSKRKLADRPKIHRIILHRGDKIIVMAFYPRIVIASLLLFICLTLSTIGSTFYFFKRDDFLDRLAKQEIQLRQIYEAKLERYKTTMATIQNQTKEQQERLAAELADLSEKQNVYVARHNRILAVLDQAREMGIQVAAVSAPMPIIKPNTQAIFANNDLSLQGDKNAIGGNHDNYDSSWSNETDIEDDTDSPESSSNNLIEQIHEFRTNLNDMQKTHFASLRALESAVWNEVNVYQNTLSKLPIKLALSSENIASGGPYIPLSYTDEEINDVSKRIKKRIDRIVKLRQLANNLPITSPLRHAIRSSSFGRRIDPFRGRLAFHSGIDFRAKTGTPVLAAAPGTVIRAGRYGGYGNVVEIRHSMDLTSRYAHLSRIHVKVGHKVVRGDIIGKVGSTGRSTGPHLHYEIRHRGQARNPQPFLDAGRQISSHSY